MGGAIIFQNRFINLETNCTIAIKINDRFTARSKHDITHISKNLALVSHHSTHQYDRPSRGSRHNALVDNPTCRFTVGKAHDILISHKLSSIHIQASGDKTANIYCGTAPKNDAVWITQKNMPVGINTAKNLTGVLIKNSIENRRRGGGLFKAYEFVLANIEALPLNDHVIAILLDQGGCDVGVGYLTRATNNLAAFWSSQRNSGLKE